MVDLEGVQLARPETVDGPTDPFNQTYLCKDGRWIGVYCNEYVEDKVKCAKLFGIVLCCKP